MEEPEPLNAEEHKSTGYDPKTIAIIAYLTIIGLVIAFLLNNDKKHEFSSYHIRQSLGLVLCSVVLFVIGMLPVLGWIVSLLGSIFLLILWVLGLINAINNEIKPVPVLGEYFDEWFKNI